MNTFKEKLDKILRITYRKFLHKCHTLLTSCFNRLRWSIFSFREHWLHPYNERNCCFWGALLRVKGEELFRNISSVQKWQPQTSAMACSLFSLQAFKLTGLIMCELLIFPFVFHGLSVSTCLSISLLHHISSHSLTTKISSLGFFGSE